MSVYGVILDVFINTGLFRTAYRRRRELNRIEDLQEMVALRLVQMMRYSDSDQMNDWRREINSWLKFSQSRGGKAVVRLTQRDFRRIFFEEPLGTVEDVQITMNTAALAVGDTDINDLSEVTQLHQRLREVMTDITRDLGSGRFSSVEDYL